MMKRRSNSSRVVSVIDKHQKPSTSCQAKISPTTKQHVPGDPLTKKRVSMEHRRYSSPPMHMESCASCRKKGGGPLFLVTPPVSLAVAMTASDAATKRAAAKRVVKPPISMRFLSGTVSRFASVQGRKTALLKNTQPR